LKVHKIPTSGTVPVEKIEIKPGGTAGNIARIAGLLGVETTLISRISKNFPPEYIKLMKDSGVNTDFEVLDDYGPVCYIVESNEDSVAFMYQGPMDSQGDLKRIDSKYVHFATGNPDWILNLMKMANGFKVFDPGQELSYRWSHDKLLEASKIADLVIVNQSENAILDHYKFREKIVTLGEKGCEYDGKIIEGFKSKVISTVGAGDAFRAGLYYGLSLGYDMNEACRCGNIVAALYISGETHKLSILKSKKSCREFP